MPQCLPCRRDGDTALSSLAGAKMKAIAMRLGTEFHDEADVRYLLRFLNISSVEAALEVIGRFYPEDRAPPKTLFALQELLGGT